MEINGIELEPLDPMSVRGDLPGKLCWQVFTKGTTASIHVRREGNAVFHLYYFSYDGPSGQATFNTPSAAHEATKALGGEFVTEMGPRGD